MERMRLDTLSPRGWREPAVTVGNFDGVHRGHRSLVEAAVRQARERRGTAVALTFDPHPSRVLSPDRAPSTLMTLDQRAEALAALGIECLAVLPFTFELSRESAADFARKVLREAMGARVVVVGENFRFGRGREGDLAALASGSRWASPSWGRRRSCTRARPSAAPASARPWRGAPCAPPATCSAGGSSWTGRW